MRSAEAGCGQRASPRLQLFTLWPSTQVSNLKSADFRSLAPTLYQFYADFGPCWRAGRCSCLQCRTGYLPAGSKRTWDLERQERGAFVDMGQEHMAYRQGGGLPISVPSLARRFAHWGLASSYLCMCMCMCVHICYLMELLGTWQDHTRQGTSGDGWSGHIEALRPSLQLQPACATDAHQSRSASIDAGLAQGAVAGCETTFPPWGASRNNSLPMRQVGCAHARTQD